MPNWCENNMYVYGNSADVAEYANKVKEALGNDKSILESMYPMPQDIIRYEERKAKVPYDSKEYKEHINAIEHQCETFHGVPNAFEWRCQKWGSKWGDCETDVAFEETSGRIFFTSAWSPPLPGMLHISKEFPNLTFVLCYEESGMDFWGVVGFSNGKIILHKEGSLSQFVKEPVPDDEQESDSYYDLVSEWVSNGIEVIIEEVTSYVLSKTLKS
jgi:hypothetical protein